MTLLRCQLTQRVVIIKPTVSGGDDNAFYHAILSYEKEPQTCNLFLNG